MGGRGLWQVLERLRYGLSRSLTLIQAFALKPQVGSPLGISSDPPGLEAQGSSPAMMAMFAPNEGKNGPGSSSVNRREEL